MYAIVDVETSGMTSDNCKITDIAIIIHDGEKIIDEFKSLVNPDKKISRKITRLTGIDNEMVKHAPKFYEIAKKVFEMTEDNIFVAHNVSFDYRIIRKEFEELGGDFIRRQLCTVRTARRLLKGSKSYSLGNICADLNIPITDRHRAYGDALATSKLFDILLDKSKEDGNSLFPPETNKKKQALIPPLLPRAIYDNLSTQTGIYYFHNEHGEVIYVGKAKNIKQRCLSHFHDKSRKEIALCEKTANITYEITGSELAALLLESSEIKSLMPKYNHSQKRLSEGHELFIYMNRDGINELRVGKRELGTSSIATFHTKGQAEKFMHHFAGQHELCHRYTGLEKTKTACFSHKLKVCKGVCCNQEDVNKYNKRVDQAIRDLKIRQNECIVLDRGRDADENVVVHLSPNGYKGFGYIPTSENVLSFDGFLPYITPRDDNRDIQRIIRNYLINHPELQIIERG
jgi:DNA polymerase-3 subunit epsilon